MHVVWNRHNSLDIEALRGHGKHETHSEEKNYGVTTIQILGSDPILPSER